jgi:xylulokinase
MRVIGGGARGRLWRQIMADIYGVPVQRPALLEEATSLGAALAGGVGVGLFPDFTVAEQLNPVVDTVLPNPDNRDRYTRGLDRFNRAYAAFEPLFPDWAE